MSTNPQAGIYSDVFDPSIHPSNQRVVYLLNLCLIRSIPRPAYRTAKERLAPCPQTSNTDPHHHHRRPKEKCATFQTQISIQPVPLVSSEPAPCGRRCWPSASMPSQPVTFPAALSTMPRTRDCVGRSLSDDEDCACASFISCTASLFVCSPVS